MENKRKATVGRLIYCLPSTIARTLESNKPFSILQKLKKEYMQRGFKKEYLKITY